MRRQVAITGVGLISALGDSSSSLFEALCDGRGGVRPVENGVANGCGCHLAAQLVNFKPEDFLSGRPLRPLDRISQMAAAACGLALQSSQWTSHARTSGAEFAIVMGTMFGGMHTVGEFDRIAITSGPSSVSPMAFANTVISAAAGQSAIWHDLRGCNSTATAGSISGISAIGHGAALVGRGRSEVVLSGGADEFSIESFSGFAAAGLLCTNGEREEMPIPFDHRRNGFALGEGAAFFALEELEHARRRGATVLAEVKGYASAFDVSQGKDPHRAQSTITRAMNTAIARSGITAREIDFVSASANGSVTHDCYELSAMASVFGEHAQDLPITAVKSGTGEALGASGAFQLAAALETFKSGNLPGIIGLEELPPGCPLKGVRRETRRVRAKTALINGIGLDGNCCSLIVALTE